MLGENWPWARFAETKWAALWAWFDRSVRGYRAKPRDRAIPALAWEIPNFLGHKKVDLDVHFDRRPRARAARVTARAKMKVHIGFFCVALLAAAPAAARVQTQIELSAHDYALLSRITWGASESDARELKRLGPAAWLDHQLHPGASDRLPRDAQDQINALTLLSEPLPDLVRHERQQAQARNAITDPTQRAAADAAYQQSLNDVVNQARTRAILRDLYASDQLREQMVWFWMNHFNVFQYKDDVRLLIGDFEERAIRPHALGRFRDLLEATLRHPAMLRYLDNAQNAAGHINENYARELMELHTVGVNGGYTQADVQALAHILTGVGIDENPNPPALRPGLQSQLIRDGLFEFNPTRHDFGAQTFLGVTIASGGYDQVRRALDMLARRPATAHFISQQLAMYFMGGAPAGDVVEHMAATFERTDGDIARVLATLFNSREFTASLDRGVVKDPMHYAISAVRLAYNDRVVRNTAPVQNWLTRMGEGLYNHDTPDGYPLSSTAWLGPGQLDIRFEIASALGGGSAGLFHTTAGDEPAFPNLRNSLFYTAIEPTLRQPTQAGLAQATSQQDWNVFFLCSPDFMMR